MNPLVSELAAILTKESSIHEQLVAAAAEMNDALRLRRTAVVARCNGRYDSLCCQIETIEEKRLDASDRLADSLGCTRRHATIRQIIVLLPKAEATILATFRERLRALLGELNRLNCSNRIFLESGLRLIEKTFEIIANNSRKTTGYQAQGAQARMSLDSTVINRVA